MKKKKLTIVIWILSMVVALGAGIFALTEECVHTGSWSEWETVQEATCSSEGKKTRKCARCREVEEATIEKTAHNIGTFTVTKKATCTEDGQRVAKCKDCGAIAKTEKISARGYHTYVEDTAKRVNATCTVDGSMTLICSACGDVKKEKIVAVGCHSWDDANPTFIYRDEVVASCTTEGYTAHKECTRCGEKNDEYEMTAPQHPNRISVDAVAMSCASNTVGYTAGEKCADCGVWVEGHELIPVEHTLNGEWVEEIASTCSVQGKETQECSVCHEEQFRALPLLNHAFTLTVPAKPATCLENGWTQHKKCENCGMQDASYQIREKIGHIFDRDGVCTQSNCNVYTYEFMSNGDGTYSLSKIIIGEGDTRTSFEIPAIVPNTTYPVTGVLDYACEGLEVSRKFTIVLPESIKVIGSSAFENCANLETINLEYVETIGDSAFEGCSSLKNIQLNGVKEIARAAFKDCTSLTEVVLPETIESVGYMAFRGCKNLATLTVAYIGGTADDTNEFGYIFGTNNAVPTSLKNVTVLTAEEVYANAFAGVGSIEKIELPATVTEIAESAFARCVSLGAVYFVGSSTINDFSAIETIGEKAFESVKFMEITLPFIVEDKLGYVFGGTNESVPESLKTVKVANATEIKPLAFAGSAYVETIELPATVNAIGDSAFSNCSALTTLAYSAEKVTSIGAMAFAGCTALNELTLPFVAGDKLGYVFGGTNESVPESLKTLVILSGETIKDKAFENCSYIVSLTIPEVTAIGVEAFKGCSALKEIFYGDETTANYLPTTITSIGQSAFEDCFKEGFNGYWDYALGMYVQETVSLTLPFVGRDSGLNEKEDDERIGYIFGSESNEVDMPTSVTKITILNESVIAENAFAGCSYLTAIELNDSLTKISVGAFAGCTALKSVVVPDSVEEIGYRAFEGCTAIENMTVPFVGKSKFATSGSQYFGWFFGIDTSGKHDRESYKMPQTVSVTLTSAEQILNSAFINCAGLTSIVIPSTVKIVDQKTFMNCVNLETVEFVTVQDENGDDIAWALEEIGASAFSGCSKLKEVELPGSVEILETDSFNWCTSLERVVTQGNLNEALVVREIGFGAFRYSFVSSMGSSYPSYPPYWSTSSVVVKVEGVEVLGSKAFAECNATEIYISNIPADTANGVPARELTEVVDWTFFDCNSLMTLVLPDTVERIGMYGVACCEELTAFRMPKAINYIGTYAFEENAKLTILNDKDENVVEFNKGVTISSYAFENCVSLKEVVFTFELDLANPEVVVILESAFAGCTNLEFVYLPYATQITAGGVVEAGVVQIDANAFTNCGIDLYGNMYIYYVYDLTGEAWNTAWHEGANLGVTDKGEPNKNLIELTDLNEDGKIDYEDYKLAKASAI